MGLSKTLLNNVRRNKLDLLSISRYLTESVQRKRKDLFHWKYLILIVLARSSYNCPGVKSYKLSRDQTTKRKEHLRLLILTFSHPIFVLS